MIGVDVNLLAIASGEAITWGDLAWILAIIVLVGLVITFFPRRR